jgi:LuxR family transcriptional regulator, maltose regulon positive regulatory protein
VGGGGRARATALDAIEEHRVYDYAISLLAFAAAARLVVHRGDATEVDRPLAHAMRARPSCTFAMPVFAVRPRLQLAKVYRAHGDATAARHLLKEIDDILSHRPDLVRWSTRSTSCARSSPPARNRERAAVHP